MEKKKGVFTSISGKLTAYFVIAAIILALGGTYFHYVRSEEAISQEINNHFETALYSYSGQIENYLDLMESQINILSRSSDVKTIVDKQLIESQKATEVDIKNFSHQVANDLENYIEKNPKTIAEYRKDKEFRKLALRSYKETGYTSVVDYDTLEVYVHKQKDMEGKIFQKDACPSLWVIAQQSLGGKESSGFYDWSEPDGRIEKKYMYNTPIPIKTKDGKGLIVATTMYVREISERIDTLPDAQKSLKDFVKFNSFQNIYILDAEGNLIWTTDSNISLINVKDSRYGYSGMLETYNLASTEDKIEHSSFEHVKDYDAPVMFWTSPVHDEIGNNIGYVSFSLNAEGIENLLSNIKGLEKANVYLINKERYLLTPFKGDKLTVLNKRVFTENSKRCYSNPTSYKEPKGELFRFKDNQGITQIGKRTIIPKTGWCLLVEMSDTDALGEARTQEITTVFIILVVIFILAFLISLSIARALSVPIRKLNVVTKELQVGNFKARAEIHTGDELEELADTFNQASEALDNIDTERKGLDKAKTEFLSITSHELRSPMTPMKAQLQMILDGYFGKLTVKQKHSLDIILRNANRLDNIIKDFLEISRIEAARLKFNFKIAPITESVKRLIEEMDAFLPEKNIALNLEMEKLPAFEHDPDRAMQVLRNLINNAKKFSPKESIIKVIVRI